MRASLAGRPDLLRLPRTVPLPPRKNHVQRYREGEHAAQSGSQRPPERSPAPTLPAFPVPKVLRRCGQELKQTCGREATLGESGSRKWHFGDAIG